jgi:hypothetical protein
MVMLIEEILEDIFYEIGKNSTDSEDKSKNKGNALLNFMLSGKQPLDLAFKFFESTKAAVLDEEYIELITNKEKSAKFQIDILSIQAVVKVLQNNIKKLQCKKFNEEYLPFWDAMKSNIKELELNDFNFDNAKYVEAVKNMESLDKAIIELDIYCIGFLEGISLTCNELVLKGEAYDQLENGEDLKISFPSVKKLTTIGHYVGWGLTDMALETLIKNLKAFCPQLEELTLIVDDEIAGDERLNTYVELISKPTVDEKLNLKVVLNFTMMEFPWQKSSFHSEIKKHPDIHLLGSKDGSQSKIILDKKKFIEINLASEMDEEDESSEESSLAEPAAKKMKV